MRAASSSSRVLPRPGSPEIVTTEPMPDCAAEIRSPILSSSSSLPRRGAGDLNALSSGVAAAGITPRASPRSPHYGVRAANDSQLARVGLSPARRTHRPRMKLGAAAVREDDRLLATVQVQVPPLLQREDNGSQLGARFRQVVLIARRARRVEAALNDPYILERPQPRRED